MGNLSAISLAAACERFRERVRYYLEDKRKKIRRKQLGELDHFPCWYCAKYMGKAAPVWGPADAGWMPPAAHAGRINVAFK